MAGYGRYRTTGMTMGNSDDKEDEDDKEDNLKDDKD